MKNNWHLKNLFKLKYLLLSCGFFIIIFIFIWIGQHQSSRSHLKSKACLVIQLVNEPSTLDPTYAEDGISLLLLNNLSEGLLGYNVRGELEKRLAQDYEISPDKKCYRFYLRKDVVWSDGKPLRAEDFALALYRALSPSYPSLLAPLLDPIEGARDYRNSMIGKNQLGISTEKNTLIIQLSKPAPYLLKLFSLPFTFPLRKDILEKNKNQWPEHAPGIGAYQCIRHQFEQKLIFKANPLYWNQKPHIKNIEFLVISSETTGLHLFEQGKLDVLWRVSPYDLSRLKKSKRIYTAPLYITYFLSFNTRIPPFHQSYWRKAFAAVIQREEIAKLLGSGAKATWSWIPKGLEGFLPKKELKKQFLEEQETVRQERFFHPEIQAGFDSGERNARILEKIQHDILNRLGIRLKLQHFEWRSYLSQLKFSPPALFRFAWMAPFNDPILHLRVFKTNDPNNYTGFSDPHYDALVDQIERLDSGKNRRALVQKAQKLLLEKHAILIPIYHYVQNIGLATRVRGFKMNPFGVVNFKNLYFGNEKNDPKSNL